MSSTSTTTTTYTVTCDLCLAEYGEVTQEDERPTWPAGWREVSVSRLPGGATAYADVCGECMEHGRLKTLTYAADARLAERTAERKDDED